MSKRLAWSLLISIAIHVFWMVALRDLGANYQPVGVERLEVKLIARASNVMPQTLPPSLEPREPSTEPESSREATKASKSEPLPKKSDTKSPSGHVKSEAVQELPPSSGKTVSSVPDSPIFGSVADGVPLPLHPGVVRRASISFDVFVGAERKLSGQGQHLFVSDQRENFGISINQGSDQLSIGEGAWKIKISGKIAGHGLAPVLYESEGGFSSLLFGAGSKEISHVKNPQRPRKWRVPDGLLDIQTLMYFFMSRPNDVLSGTVWLVGVEGGAVLAEYRFSGIDTLLLGNGNAVRSSRFVFSSAESKDYIELWVATDYRNLPLKIRFLDNQGEVVEQVATAMDFN